MQSICAQMMPSCVYPFILLLLHFRYYISTQLRYILIMKGRGSFIINSNLGYRSFTSLDNS